VPAPEHPAQTPPHDFAEALGAAYVAVVRVGAVDAEFGPGHASPDSWSTSARPAAVGPLRPDAWTERKAGHYQGAAPRRQPYVLLCSGVLTERGSGLRGGVKGGLVFPGRDGLVLPACCRSFLWGSHEAQKT